MELPTSPLAMARPRPRRAPSIRASTVAWILVVASVARVTIFAYRRDAGEYADINTSALMAILLTFAGLAALRLSPASMTVWRHVRSSSLAWLYVYYAFCGLTAAWSVSPGFSGFRALEALTQIALVTLGAYFTRDLWRAERLLFVGSLVMVLMSVVGRLRFYEFELSKEALHSNQYPVIAAATALYCLGEYLADGPVDGARRRQLRNWGLTFAVLAAIGTSAGTMVAIFVGLLALGMMQRFDRRVLVVAALALLASMYAYGISRNLWWDVLFVDKEYEDVLRLSGRRGMFEAYLAAAREKPVLGYGFAVAARIGERFGTVTTTHAHNGLLEMLLGGGLVGLSLGLRWLYRLVREMTGALRRRSAGAAGCGAAFVVISVNNLTITAYGGPWNPPLTHLAYLLALFCFFVHPASAEQAADRREPPAAGADVPRALPRR